MSVVAIIAILVCIPALALQHPPLVRSLSRRVDLSGLGPTLVACALGALLWLVMSAALPGLVGTPLRWPIAALVALAVYLCSVGVRPFGARTRVLVGFCGIWCGVVVVPAAALVFVPETFGFTISSSAWDLGGAVPVHVAGGAAVLALLRVRTARDARRGESGPGEGGRETGGITDRGVVGRSLTDDVRSTAVLVTAGLVLWAAWVASLVGLDMAIDSVTPLIVRNGVVVPLASIAGWLVVERVRTHKTTLRGAGGGLVGGLVAITPAGGSLGLAWALALGLVVGIVCAACAVRASTKDVRPGRYLVAVHLIAASLGLLWVGLFGDGGGFVYTGQFGTVQVQLAVTVVVAGWSYVVAILLSPMLHPRHPPR